MLFNAVIDFTIVLNLFSVTSLLVAWRSCCLLLVYSKQTSYIVRASFTDVSTSHSLYHSPYSHGHSQSIFIDDAVIHFRYKLKSNQQLESLVRTTSSTEKTQSTQCLVRTS